MLATDEMVLLISGALLSIEAIRGIQRGLPAADGPGLWREESRA
jgi:hypothetical protein